MSTESDLIRQQKWALAVRRSFGIPDLASHEDARNALVEWFEEELRKSEWLSAPRAVADAMADSLMTFGASSDFDVQLLFADPPTEAAYRLMIKGRAEVDPDHLVFDVRDAYPPEVATVAELALVRVVQSAREQLNGLI